MNSGTLSELRDVLAAWRLVPPDVVITPVAPGFSGAGVYRVRTSSGSYALRVWPAGEAGLPEDRILELHRWLKWLSETGVSTIAVPLAADDGSTLVSRRQRWWQLEPWLPGAADFHREPTDTRLRNTCAALARLHIAAERYVASPAGREWFWSGQGAAPAVGERLVKLRQLARSGPAAPFHGPADEQRALAMQWGSQLPELSRRVAAELDRFSAIRLRLHPCLRDVWHDHILLTAEEVTGIVDPSAARTENVASDLSRLLGSLLGDDFSRWDTALDAYAAVRPLSVDERRLVRALDRSGVVLSAAHWLERISAAPLTDREWGRVRTLADRVASLERADA